MKPSQSLKALASCALLGLPQVQSLTVDFSSPDSIKSAMSTATYDMMTWYVGNETGQTPGILPYQDPSGYRYYWWQAGAMMGTLIDYWYFTGDTTYNDEVTVALQYQAGPQYNYEPSNESLQLGNDDQSFWAFSAMQAAEYNYPNPPDDEPSWLSLVQAVFNLQAERWDPSTCGGGIRWQIYQFNPGWDYKNSPSNGCLFQIGARLAKYTGNDTYAQVAAKEFDWLEEVGLITSDYHVYDGATPTLNCSSSAFNTLQWSYTYAILVYGCAVMWNYTAEADPSSQSLWETRATGLIGAMSQFFSNNIIYEPTCEQDHVCNSDQQSFAAYSGRFLGASTKVAPFTESLLSNYLADSAAAAAASCIGGTSGTFCGLNWVGSSFDGEMGIGEQMNAIEFFGSQLWGTKPGPLTAKSGGTSKSNPSAGTNDPTAEPGTYTSPITTGDRAGAGILTALVMVMIVGTCIWLMA